MNVDEAVGVAETVAVSDRELVDDLVTVDVNDVLAEPITVVERELVNVYEAGYRSISHMYRSAAESGRSFKRLSATLVVEENVDTDKPQ